MASYWHFQYGANNGRVYIRWQSRSCTFEVNESWCARDLQWMHLGLFLGWDLWKRVYIHHNDVRIQKLSVIVRRCSQRSCHVIGFKGTRRTETQMPPKQWSITQTICFLFCSSKTKSVVVSSLAKKTIRLAIISIWKRKATWPFETEHKQYAYVNRTCGIDVEEERTRFDNALLE